jgi:hypothetical protein
MDYYSHTIRITNFNIYDAYRIDGILKIGYLLSRNKLKGLIDDDDRYLCEETALFNGMDYISLCDLSCIHNEYSAFNMYVKKGVSLLFSKRLEVIKPKIVSIQMGNAIFGDDAHKLGMGIERYSDLSDEVQVRDCVSMEYLKGILLSLHTFYHYHNEIYLVEYINLLKEILETNGYHVPIINLDTENEIIVEKEKIKTI